MIRTSIVTLAVAGSTVVFGSFAGIGAKAPPLEVVTPTEDSVTLFANPGMGWQTFYRTADNDLNTQFVPSSTVYWRFSWAELEPREGEFDFAVLDDFLDRARHAGQRLAWRLMIAASEDPGSPSHGYAPLWLRDVGASGYVYYYDGNGNTKNVRECPDPVNDCPEPLVWTPDLADETANWYHERLIRELGRRYSQHPFMDLLDIGSVGLWGEWHFSDAVIDEIVGHPPSGGQVGGWVPTPSFETKRAVIDDWIDAFPTTPKAMLPGTSSESPDSLEYATHVGSTGWRGDCWGDMSYHMTYYGFRLLEADALSAWRRGPVAFEPCYEMDQWPGRGWDTAYALRWALENHATYIHNKLDPIPSKSLADVQDSLRRMGYRLVLRELTHPRIVAAGSELELSMKWDNVGVAPPYWDYYVAVRLERKGGRNAVEKVYPRLQSVKGWQPGPRRERVRVSLPASMPSGRYDMSVGVFSARPEHVHPNLKSIKLAITEPANADGWYPLSEITIH